MKPSVPTRDQICIGMNVVIVEKHQQRTGQTSEGKVARILSPGSVHPHGIKVMLTDGRVGRVQDIVKDDVV